MRIFKNQHIASVFFFVAAVLVTPGYLAAGDEHVNANKKSLQAGIKCDWPQQKEASAVQLQVEKAKKAGKVMFVVITGEGIVDANKALKVAKEATTLHKGSEVIQMNRDDKANAQLVAEWRVAGAPLPLLLVVSSKGIVTGGYELAEATAEKLVSLVPSPKMEEIYSIIGAGKTVFVVFTKKGFEDQEETIMECREAVRLLENKASIVEVRVDDQREFVLMDQMDIDKTANTSTVLVINTRGQVVGNSISVPEAAKLVAAAKKPVKSGCGPACAPGGCK